MTLFWTSFSIVCAFFLGGLVGGRLAFRFATKLFEKTYENLQKNVSLRTPIASLYAYDQVRNRIEGGSTAEELIVFIDEELEKHRQSFESVGAEAGEDLARDWVQQRRGPSSGEHLP